MQVGGRQEDVDAVFGSRLDGAGGSFDVFALTAGEGSDAGALNFFGDGSNGRGVAVRGYGEAGLDDVDAERGKLVRHAQLFRVMHGAAGRLLAVAEGGIEKDDLVGVRHRKAFRSGHKHNALLC